MDSLLELENFTHRAPDRFFSTMYDGRGTWTVDVYLGRGFTAPGARRVPRGYGQPDDRWLKATASSQAQALTMAAAAVRRTRRLPVRDAA